MPTDRSKVNRLIALLIQNGENCEEQKINDFIDIISKNDEIVPKIAINHQKTSKKELICQ